MTIIFTDIETTGLNAAIHQVTEIAYATEKSEVISLIIPHTLDNADPKALELTHYYERNLGDQNKWCSKEDIDLMVEHMTRATICGANPRFDMLRISLLLGGGGLALAQEPWGYRSLDVQSMASAIFNWENPRGLFSISKYLRENMYDIPEPDHSAAGDVITTRAVYQALRDVQARKIYSPKN